MVYKKILKCTICKKNMTSRTARRLRCTECKKIYLRKYKKEWLNNPGKRVAAYAVAKIYQKNNQEARTIRQREYTKNNPERILAHNLSQKIKRKECCELCGENKVLQKHHWNYSNPLLLSTLCSTCHAIQHIKKFNESRYAEVIVCGV